MNTEPQIVRLFPTTVYKCQLDTPQIDILIEAAKTAIPTTKNANTTDADGDSYYHLKPEFEQLFDQIKEHAFKYMYGQNAEQAKNIFDVYVIKSWIVDFSRTEDNSIHRHVHDGGDLSVVYYGAISNSPLFFAAQDNPCNIYGLNTSPNDLVIFSSDAIHWVDRSTSKDPRVSMSADLIFVLKEGQKSYEFVRNPINTWKRL